MTDAEFIARAHAVTDGATPGPWNFGHAGEHMTKAERQQWLADTCGDHDGPLWATWVMGDRGEADVVIPAATGDGERARENAAFIAASRTMLPAAVAAIEAVLDECDRIDETWINRKQTGDDRDDRWDAMETLADAICAAVTAHLDPS